MKLDIVGLLTTVTYDYQRISMHGVRRELLHLQAREMGLPLHEVMIPKNATNEIYEENMGKKILELKEKEGISAVVFGDLFLQDVRSYRERFLAKLGLDCDFPIWGRNTQQLAKSFIKDGFRAEVCCIDPKKIGSEFCGREYDLDFLSNLPKSADPCGENGEFHTFVYAGPIFQKNIDIKVGEVVERDGYYFADILPENFRAKAYPNI
jgi:uncharacterized protein (TIGR00290 family)